MDNKEKGQQLEWVVAEYIKPLDKYARPTRNSGGSTELGDVNNKYFMVECKNWDRKNVVLNHDIWQKLLRELPINSTRVPILVQKNSLGDTFVSLDIKDFFNIAYKAFGYEK
jgi:hypothetical protein